MDCFLRGKSQLIKYDLDEHLKIKTTLSVSKYGRIRNY